MTAPEHTPECRWTRTAEQECGYKATHYYCPHPEHGCDCKPPTTVKTNLADELATALAKEHQPAILRYIGTPHPHGCPTCVLLARHAETKP